MKTLGRSILYIVCALALLPSCVRSGEDDTPEELQSNTLRYVNEFTYNVMNVYYLWVDEIQDKLKEWTYSDDPQKKVKEVRYKDAAENDIDRWTQVTDDYESFVSSIEGVSTTYGYEMTLYYADEAKENVVAAVEYVYADSPAALAGLRRGDIIEKVDGSPVHTVRVFDCKIRRNADFLLSSRTETTYLCTNSYSKSPSCSPCLPSRHAPGRSRNPVYSG